MSVVPVLLREWCQPMRDPALTRCPDSLTTTQQRGGRCNPPERSSLRFSSADLLGCLRLCEATP